MELFFNEADFPVVALLLEVGQVVAAVDIDDNLLLLGREESFWSDLLERAKELLESQKEEQFAHLRQFKV